MQSLNYEPRSGESWRDPWDGYRALRDQAPVFHVEKGDYWVLSRFEDVWQAARDVATFSSASGLTTNYGDMEAMNLAPTMVMMDPPQHTAFRKLISAGFTPRKATDLEPAMRSYIAARIEEMRAADRCDFIAGLARPLPCWVVANYLGVPAQDRGLFDGWTHAIVGGAATGDLLGSADGAAAAAELYAYFTELIEAKRRDPGEDLITQLAHADFDGTKLEILEILGYAFVMIAGGNDTATGMIGGAAELLTRYPEQRRKLRDNPSLIRGAVEEVLRLTSPVQDLARTTMRDVEIHGKVIPKGKRVLLHYGSANRDEREFGESAGAFNVERKIDRILAFTVGPHYCIGAAVARLQGQLVLEELLARCPEFSVDFDAAEYATGVHVRRHETLPFQAVG
ncbi:MAG: cytochrome P450 [Deltaproteobacteria bacterium]